MSQSNKDKQSNDPRFDNLESVNEFNRQMQKQFDQANPTSQRTTKVIIFVVIFVVFAIMLAIWMIDIFPQTSKQ